MKARRERAIGEAMEARSVAEIPRGPQWLYEPKWDGFRCLLARNGGTVRMVSKAGQDLARYFPEVVAAARTLRETTFRLDGELVVPVGDRFSFDDLLQRIHPAASRIRKLSADAPACYIAFDLLQRGRKLVADLKLVTRREALEQFAARNFTGTLFKLSPASLKPADAKRWLSQSGNVSDGVIAKRLDLPYQ